MTKYQGVMSGYVIAVWCKGGLVGWLDYYNSYVLGGSVKE